MSEEKIKLDLKKAGNVQENVTEVYLRSIIAIPEILHQIAESLTEINECLSILALYLERKGAHEALITPEDLEQGGEDGPAMPN